MANMHILTRQGANFTVVYHIAVPNGNNPAGTNWRTALVSSGRGGTTILPAGDGSGGTISAAEKALIESGAVLEQVVQIDPTQGGSNTTLAQINACLDADYATNSQSLLIELQGMLAQYGRTRG